MAHLLKDFPPYGNGKPIPTPLRNHQMIQDYLAGRGPHYLRTDEALQKMFADVQNDPKKIRKIESEAWEDFLDMTMSQALLWAATAWAVGGVALLRVTALPIGFVLLMVPPPSFFEDRILIVPRYSTRYLSVVRQQSRSATICGVENLSSIKNTLNFRGR